MARVIVSSDAQAEETIQSLLSSRSDVDSVTVDVFKVNDYLGISLEIADTKSNESFYLTGSTGLAKKLNKMGLKTGDSIIVARHPYQVRPACMYMVAPLTDATQYLVGKDFTAPPKAGLREKAGNGAKAGLKKEVR